MLEIRQEWYGQHFGWLVIGSRRCGWYVRLWGDWHLVWWN